MEPASSSFKLQVTPFDFRLSSFTAFEASLRFAICDLRFAICPLVVHGTWVLVWTRGGEVG